MKVALCLSGAPRLEDSCVENQLRAFHGATSIDVFVYMWNTYPEGDEAFLDKLRQRLGSEATIANAVFAPEYQHPTQLSAITYPETKIENVLKMYCAIERVDALRRATEYERRDRYDLVIRSRTDLLLDTAIDLRRLARVAEDHLIVPRNGHWRGGLSDQFAVSSAMNMTIYASLFSRLNAYVESGVIAHPETLLRHHCRAQNLPIMLADTQTVLMRDGNAKLG